MTARRLCLGWLLLLSSLSVAAVHPGDPSGEEILRKVESRLNRLRDYTVTLNLTADIERLNIPPMAVKMYYKQPDKVHFDSRGFALLPREGVALNIGRLLARYTVTRVGREAAGDARLYKLTLSAKSDRTRIRSIALYVHPGRWTVEKLVSAQPGDREMSATFRYAEIGGFWLPEELIASFHLAPADTTEPGVMDQPPPTRPQLAPRNGTITVRYSEYQLNTGLSDEIFKEPAGND
ncbi:MAG: hypothetical protein AB1428_02215 [Bacteroidota bacterium]